MLAALHSALEARPVAIDVLVALLHAGIDVDAVKTRHPHFTPLRTAATANLPDACRLLLDAGASVDKAGMATSWTAAKRTRCGLLLSARDRVEAVSRRVLDSLTDATPFVRVGVDALRRLGVPRARMPLGATLALCASAVPAYRRVALCSGAHVVLQCGTMLHMMMRTVIECECAARGLRAPLWLSLRCVELDVVARLACDRSTLRRSSAGTSRCCVFRHSCVEQCRQSTSSVEGLECSVIASNQSRGAESNEQVDNTRASKEQVVNQCIQYLYTLLLSTIVGRMSRLQRIVARSTAPCAVIGVDRRRRACCSC
jgi:hypothetical protein